MLKTTHTEERSVHTKTESCNIQLESKKINLIPNKSFRYYTTNSHQLFLDAFIYSWYFIIFKIEYFEYLKKLKFFLKMTDLINPLWIFHCWKYKFEDSKPYISVLCTSEVVGSKKNIQIFFMNFCAFWFLTQRFFSIWHIRFS